MTWTQKNPINKQKYLNYAWREILLELKKFLYILSLIFRNHVMLN